MKALRAIAVLIGLVLLLPLRLAGQEESAGSITGEQAREHIGETVTVCGVVASARYAAAADGQPTFLNLDDPYPDQSLVVVIPGNLRPAFATPEETLLKARVCATGVVEELSQPAGLLRVVIERKERLVVGERS